MRQLADTNHDDKIDFDELKELILNLKSYRDAVKLTVSPGLDAIASFSIALFSLVSGSLFLTELVELEVRASSFF